MIILCKNDNDTNIYKIIYYDFTFLVQYRVHVIINNIIDSH